jgi:hypothetical protein
MSEPITLNNGVGSELDAIAASTLDLVEERALVDAFLNERGEVLADDIKEETRVSFARSLRELGLRPIDLADAATKTKFDKGDFDEYFAVAWQDARKKKAGNDPIDTIRNQGTANWNFEVKLFDALDQQGIIQENIRAAGALDYVYVLGEKMGIFRLADALVLRWASGEIDIGQPGNNYAPSGKFAVVDKMYRYFKLRQERLSDEERASVYRRVIAKGDGELLSRMVPNEGFPNLWGNLMQEFVSYIRKLEDSYGDEGLVSRTPIYEATKLLQVNLSENMTGMALMQTREMYFQLDEAMAILGDPAVVQSVVGGRRLNVWSCIEALAREELQVSLNTAALRSEAQNGNAVFKWVSEFDKSAVADSAFRAARDAAESYILAQAALGDAPLPNGDEEASEGDDFATEGETDNDDFGDF